MGVLIGCACVLFAVFIGLMIVSVIIRAAVWVANKCLGETGGGGYQRRSRDDYYDDDDDYYDDDDDYDDRPRRRPPPRRRGSAIPEPELFKGMGIGFLVWICQVVVSLVFAFLLVGAGGMGGGGFGGGQNNPFGAQPGVDPVLQIMSSCVQLVIGFLIWSGILSLMLPTSFGRAALVTVFIYLILFAIGIIILMAAFAIGFAGAGLR